MKKGTTVVVPIRKGSQRVEKKNIRPIGHFKYGLTEIKLRQLLSCDAFEEILIDTDVDEIGEILASIPRIENGPVIRVEMRPAKLAGSDATTDDLIQYIIGKIETENFVWTHVTSPFFNGACYKRFMDQFNTLPDGKDSLVAVDSLREFLWNEDGPINYDRSILRWPFTQTLKPVYLINSAAFGISTQKAKEVNDRMGATPEFFTCTGLEGFDVDWADQFKIVELLVQNGYSII